MLEAISDKKIFQQAIAREPMAACEREYVSGVRYPLWH